MFLWIYWFFSLVLYRIEIIIRIIEDVRASESLYRCVSNWNYFEFNFLFSCTGIAQTDCSVHLTHTTLGKSLITTTNGRAILRFILHKSHISKHVFCPAKQRTFFHLFITYTIFYGLLYVVALLAANFFFHMHSSSVLLCNFQSSLQFAIFSVRNSALHQHFHIIKKKKQIEWNLTEDFIGFCNSLNLHHKNAKLFTRTKQLTEPNRIIICWK